MIKKPTKFANFLCHLHSRKRSAGFRAPDSHCLKSSCYPPGLSHLFGLPFYPADSLWFPQRATAAAPWRLSKFHVLPLGLEKWWFVLEVTSLSAAQWVWTTLPFGYLTKAGSQKGVWHTWQSFLSDRTVVLRFSLTCKAGEKNTKHHCKSTHEQAQAYGLAAFLPSQSSFLVYDSFRHTLQLD